MTSCMHALASSYLQDRNNNPQKALLLLSDYHYLSDMTGEQSEKDSGVDAEKQAPDRQTPFSRKGAELLDLINKSGKITLDDATKVMGLKKDQVVKMAEALRRGGKIRVNIRFMRDPEFEAVRLPTPVKRPEEKKPPSEGPRPSLAAEIPAATQTVEKAKPPEPQPPAELKPAVTGPAQPKEAKTEFVEEIEAYDVPMGAVSLPVRILGTGDYVYHYDIALPHIDFVTKALLDEIKRSLVGEIQIEARDIINVEKLTRLKSRFIVRSKEKLRNMLKKAPPEYIELLSKIVINEMIGLGEIEYLLSDDHLEDVVVNNSKDVVWVYHKKYGWLKTNITVPTEEMIQNYAARVAREVGREITHIQPLLDAHLTTGDRVNATLSPISTLGNTISIRRFSRVPWTIVHFLDPKIKTINYDAAAFLWMAIEYEMSMLVAGGTASGKTSMLNALMPFMPANQRIISMEDTRELNLPEYLHWIPMAVRAPNPQGEGEVSMLDLIVNALRMRPDRIIIGEVRRKRETEVLFEAMHTGHSVYGTFHAEQAHEVVDRITSPPMEIPGQVLKSLQLIVVQYRNRRTGQRRTFEITELTKEDDQGKPGLNTLYKWHPRTDTIESLYPSVRVKDEIGLFGGITEREMEEDLSGKKEVLKWLVDNNISDINQVGKVVAQYYLDPDIVVESMRERKSLS